MDPPIHPLLGCGGLLVYKLPTRKVGKPAAQTPGSTSPLFLRFSLLGSGRGHRGSSPLLLAYATGTSQIRRPVTTSFDVFGGC